MVRVTLLALVLALPSVGALAQDESPVYVDDSPTAEQVLDQLPRLIEQDNLSEAITIIQRLLDEEPYRLVATSDDPRLYHSVRAEIHDALLGSESLLERYRVVQEPLAKRLLGEGELERVERSLLMTKSGADAALTLAERLYESADFDVASRMIEQLDRHPDREQGSDIARRSARMLARIAPLAGQESLRTLALRFADEAGLAGEITEQDIEFVERPRAATIRSAGLAEQGPAFSPSELLPRPLRSASIADSSEGNLIGASLLRGQRLSSGEPKPWLVPVLAGDLVLVNDLTRVTAWDRVTLERVWRFSPDSDRDGAGIDAAIGNFRRGNEPNAEDSSAVTVGGGVVLAVTHETDQRNRLTAPRLNALSIDTGERLWSIVPSALKREWHEANFSSQPIIVGDTAVCSLFQFSPLRRVMSTHMVGLDLYTGELRWSRLLGTAGVAPSQRIERIAHLAIEREGVVYRSDPLGVIAALDAHSGEPVWIRRLGGEEGYTGSNRQPWQQTAPIIVGGQLIVLAPDQLSVQVFNRHTGGFISEREASSLGWPDYILRSGDRLISVGASLTTLPIDEVASAEPVEIIGSDERARGRVRLVGNKLLVPTDSGTRLIDPARPDQSGVDIDLDYPGAPTALGDQLIVADGSFVHTYLPWPTAEETLMRRMEESPDDPDIALTFAELAYRAGVVGRIADAADSALASIDRLGESERARVARDRLFASLSAMLTADLARRGSLVEAQTISPRQRGELIERLGRAASKPDQRVGHLMELARFARLQREWEDAAQAYQSILLDESLAEAQHTQGRHSQRAELAARDALGALVRDHPRAYSEFDEQARELYSTLTSDPQRASAEALEALARRYPVSRIAPEALLAASDAHAADGRLDRSIASLENALDALGSMSSRREPRSQVTGEIAGRLVRSLAEADRLFAASQTLDRVLEQRPGIRLTYFGEPIVTAELSELLAERLAGISRLPRVGFEVERMSQALIGWSLVEPLSSRGSVPRDHLMLYSREAGQLALFGIEGEVTDELGFDPRVVAADVPGALAPIWSRSAPAGTSVSLVQLQPSSALLLWGGSAEASFEMIDTVTGQTRWRTPPFGDLFEDEPDRRRTGLVETPLDGPSRLSDIMVVLGDRHVALVERTGRSAVFDRVRGDTVWAATLDVPVVYEASLSGGVLVLGGERPADPLVGEAAGVVPLVASYDIETKKLLQFDDGHTSLFRWVRTDRSGRIFVGLDAGVVFSDPKRRTQLWAINDPAVRLTGDAWLVQGRAVVLGPDRQLWQIDMESGELRDAPLEDLSRVGGSSLISLYEGADREVIFATDRGMIVFDQSGSLVGGDAAAGAERVLSPARGEEVFAMLDVDGSPHFESGSVYKLSLLNARSGLLLGRADLRLLHEPESIVLLDGHIVITAGNATLVYDAPHEPSDE
ncbi:MAG: hypothetical protein ED559_13270 [Phycisphaera sp.]|nr:MAG: hypothetical protein ED559_13270 [Phycisphaera sp.]